MEGTIFNIQRFSLQDGPGIRTTVFLKGCPLNCIWCHNPEGKSPGKSISFNQKLCIGCRECSICHNGLHEFQNNTHIFRIAECEACGKCGEACPVKALELIGKTVTAEEVISEVLRDKEFYQKDGGLTLSGGEPMFQPAFAMEIASLAKNNSLHVCLETSGYCSRESLIQMIPVVDLFLYDYKVSPDLCEKYTGKNGSMIMENLHQLNENNVKIILRCPIIPGINDNSKHINDIISLANTYHHIIEIHLQPYHAFGLAKYKNLGLESLYQKTELVKQEKLQEFASIIYQNTNKIQ